MLSKKSIVMNGYNGSSQKAVLSMECEGNMLQGKVRLYNFSSEPRGIISLGIYDKDKVVKAGLTKVSSMLFSFQTQLEKIPQKFSCAIVNFVDGEPSPLLYGTSEGVSPQEEVFADVINSLKSTTSAKDVEETLDEYGIDFDEEEKAEIESLIDKEMTKECCDNCDDCIYKKFYLKHNQKEAVALGEGQPRADQPHLTDGADQPAPSGFYSEIKEQVEKLFKENQEEDYLSQLIPNSKWVKVEYGEGGDYYVFGLLYEDEKLKYVCYGVPGVYQKNPPRELSGYPVWFPLDSAKREGFGYWLTYQDAQSGESIKAIVE